MKIHPLQKFLSFFYPVKILSASGKTTPVLSLYWFNGRWQLGAATALYSDGAAYRPLKEAFHYLQKELPKKQNMLVLGAGLGSAISVLHSIKINIPHTTLVDIDPQIIEWGHSIIKAETKANCEWICADVQQFVQSHNTRYDLIVLDIFQDRIVPNFTTSVDFLKQCRQLLSTQNGVLVLNYIINNEENWKIALQNIEGLFKIEHTISIGINRIMILRNIV